MSDKEKKAIDYLKNDVVYWLDKGKDFVVIDIGENEKLHTLLNLIKKQKKEIEELKQNRDEYKEEYIKLQNARYYNYISKDKIREKIDKYREKLEKLHSQELWNEPEDSIKDFKYNHYLEAYKKLLEEN